MTEDNIAEIIKTLKPILPSRLQEIKDYVGHRYGMLTILEILGRHEKRKHVMVSCRCDCGAIRISVLADIRRFHTKSCGCIRLGKNIHGESASVNRKAKEEYLAWSRVRIKAFKQRKDRIAKGESEDIVDRKFFLEIICERWMQKNKGYINFLEDMGRRLPKSRLRKRDNSKRYGKDNCYWRVAE